MSVSIKDIARLSGVSTATVSRTLSNPELVSEETRAQVMAVVDAQGYRVNSMARNLRRQRADSVLAIVPDLGNPFFSAIFSGLQQSLMASGMDLLVTDSRSALEQGRSLLSHLRNARVDGVICLDGGLPAAVRAELTKPENAERVVFACEWLPEGGFPSVRSDNRAGMQLAVDHLIALGHRDIAYLSGPMSNVLCTERLAGTISALSAHGLSLRPSHIGDGDFSLEGGRKAADWLMQLTPRPTAVLCASDQLAIGLASGLHGHGLRVPEDISLVGFDDIQSAEFVIPALTTVRQDRLRLGSRAAELLRAQLSAEHSAKDTVVTIPVTLQIRSSTARPRGD
jgi:LacI family transcriptional regulator, repressor for deo operon, udp, cdd, tsx, nupC, and nupG